MFIRIKKINNIEYAYLVENKYRKNRKNKVRQKTLKYLGKVYKLPKINNHQTNNNYSNLPHAKIILSLVEAELINHGFKKIKKNIFVKNNVTVNLKDKQVTNKHTKKTICLEINNNFLCFYTLKKLLNFKPKNNLTKLQIGKQLANTFNSSGIPISKEIFVILAKKIINTIEK